MNLPFIISERSFDHSCCSHFQVFDLPNILSEFWVQPGIRKSNDSRSLITATFLFLMGISAVKLTMLIHSNLCFIKLNIRIFSNKRLVKDVDDVTCSGPQHFRGRKVVDAEIASEMCSEWTWNLQSKFWTYNNLFENSQFQVLRLTVFGTKWIFCA